MKDWRRVNVAITRAKVKLIVFGSRSTLATAIVFNDFFKFLDLKGWNMELPSNAHFLHSF
jgi:DNA replication ATP-dependent helicase Dna2